MITMARISPAQRRLYEMCATAIVAKRANLEGAVGVGFDIDLPVFSVGKVGQIAEIHPRPCGNTTGRVSWCRGARKAARDGTVCATSIGLCRRST